MPLVSFSPLQATVPFSPRRGGNTNQHDLTDPVRANFHRPHTPGCGVCRSSRAYYFPFPLRGYKPGLATTLLRYRPFRSSAAWNGPIKRISKAYGTAKSRHPRPNQFSSIFVAACHTIQVHRGKFGIRESTRKVIEHVGYRAGE